jgi:hypothetical protein
MVIFNEAGNLQCLSHLELTVWIWLSIIAPVVRLVWQFLLRLWDYKTVFFIDYAAICLFIHQPCASIPYLATLFWSRTRILLLLTVSVMDCTRLALCSFVLCSTSLNEFDLLLLSRWLLRAVWFKGIAEDYHLRRHVSSKLLRKIPIHHHISSSHVHGKPLSLSLLLLLHSMEFCGGMD